MWSCSKVNRRTVHPGKRRPICIVLRNKLWVCNHYHQRGLGNVYSIMLSQGLIHKTGFRKEPLFVDLTLSYKMHRHETGVYEACSTIISTGCLGQQPRSCNMWRQIRSPRHAVYAFISEITYAWPLIKLNIEEPTSAPIDSKADMWYRLRYVGAFDGVKICRTR